MHGYPLTNGEDRGLPLTEKILPEYLKQLGYATHLVGKWHIGQSRTAYLPTSRGFDSHFGYRGGYVDYYEYMNEETWSLGQVSGFDLYRNLSAAWDVEGYITDVFTDEAKHIIRKHDESKPLFLMLSHTAPHGSLDGFLLQAPPDVVRSFRHIESPERRMFAAMIKKLDDSVGDVIETLSRKKMLENTIIVFMSDNGGMPFGRSINYASNWPLRGTKFTPFEGGVRTVALLWTPTLASNSNHLWKGNMHIIDWIPTLFGAIGADPPSNIDGVNLWDDIVLNQNSRRDTFFEIYTYPETSFSAVVSGDYKLVTGNVTIDYSDHYSGNSRGIIGLGPSYIEAIKISKMYSVLDKLKKSFPIEEINLRDNIRVDCKADSLVKLCYSYGHNVCLFDIKNDPCETRDLSVTMPDVVERLQDILKAEMNRVVDRPNPLFRDPRALPSLHNYTWATWADHVIVT
ncbi:arylsulfatase J-like isoform X2 [Pectinophora gossypiella]|nr:arylsulfatase J-like isoform X2 [Pectinophora gossypiella]